MEGIGKYAKNITPDTVGIFGGFLANGYLGGILVKKFPKITGWKAFFVRSLAKFAVGIGLYELANRFTQEDTLEYKVITGASSGAMLSIMNDSVETFTGIRLQSGQPEVLDMNNVKRKVQLQSDNQVRRVE